jgi:hypothetical protein
MRKIGTIGVVIMSGLAVATAFGRTAAAIPTDTIGLVRTVEPGDDNGGQGRGKDDLVVAAPTAAPTAQPTAEPRDDKSGHRELEPRDDKGGKGEVEPADDKGSATAEPGDDKGSATAEPGDDKGGTTKVQPGDDKGGSHHGGHGSDG